ncbi:hypothetical protein CDL15_Pgr022158 [Punica granatum]|uniref:Uncharacterized protein n=1 Tax=Punica granatum TaxID=22663 RepID=A0A218VSU7_PUNGR|nr:hypothetical protein CDL15_Pgr022158 [Punica granatum]PKI70703.1 hypothetical protein CRG98_008936 [Punica granatum]
MGFLLDEDNDEEESHRGKEQFFGGTWRAADVVAKALLLLRLKEVRELPSLLRLNPTGSGVAEINTATLFLYETDESTEKTRGIDDKMQLELC